MALIIQNNFELIENQVFQKICKCTLLKNNNRLQKAITLLEEIELFHLEKNHPTLASKIYLELSQLYYLEGTIDKVRAYFIQAYDLNQGIIDPHALRIEQNECAISTSHALGTDSLGECMAVAIYEPQTRTIGLAHIDILTKTQSISAFIEKMPKGKKTVTILGGSNEGALLEKRSKENLAKIKIATDLYKEHLDIKILAIDQAHPTAFTLSLNGVIHPHTVPMGQAKYRFARNGLASFSEVPKDLRLAYHQSGNEMVEEPINLSKDVQEALQPYTKMSAEEITKLHINQIISPKILLAEEILALLKILTPHNLNPIDKEAYNETT